MNQNVIDTQPSRQKTNNLMLSSEPFEEYNDLFLNQSISEGFFSIDINKKYQQGTPRSSSSSDDQEIIDQPHLSIPTDTRRELLFTFPLSPDPIMLSQSLFKSKVTQTDVQRHSRNSSSPAKNHMTKRSRSIYQNLVKYFLVKTFIKKLLYRRNMNSQFNLYHFNVLNDKGSVFNLKLFKLDAPRSKPLFQSSDLEKAIKFRQIVTRPITWIVQVLIKTNQILERIPIFYPETMSMLIWDGLVQIARIYFMYMIPLDLSFEQEQFMFGTQYSMSVIMIILLLFDFLVSFNTAHYKYGQIVIKRLDIAKNVVAKSGGLEIMSVFILVLVWAIKEQQSSFEVNASTQLYQLGLMIFFIQYRNISKFIRQVEQALNFSKPTKAILELMKLIIGIIVVLHVFACLWYWAGYYSQISWGKSWLELKGLNNQTWQISYLYSFYYSTVTMFTVGYGDITPQSDLEIIISIFFMMITSIQLSYSVSTVGAIIDKISAYEEEKLKRLHTINTFMQTKKIGYQLQYQVREYLNYFWEAQNEEDSQKEKAIIGQLSENLRERLMHEANSLILNNCVLFRNRFSAELKIKLVRCIRQVVVQPENVIDFDSLFPDKNENQIFLCFIEKGSIEIFVQKETNILNNAISSEGTILDQINEGQSLGVISFLTGEKSVERFRSIGFTKLLLLSRDEFLKIIPDYPEDYEQFLYLQDQIRLYSSSKFLHMECFSCKSTDHKALDCPLLHFIPDKEFIIKQQQYSRNQDRNESSKTQNVFRRQQKKSFINARLDQDFVQESAIVFQNDYWQETMFFDCYEQEPIQVQQSQNKSSDDDQDQTQQVETKKKLNFLKRQKTRNIQSTSNLDDKFNQTQLVLDYDGMQRSSMKRTNKSVQFHLHDLSINVHRQVSPLSLFDTQSQDDRTKDHQITTPLRLPKLSNFAVRVKRVNTVEISQQLQILPIQPPTKRSLKKTFQKADQIVKSLNTMDKVRQLYRSQGRLSYVVKSIIEEKKVNQLSFQRNQLQNLIQRRQYLIQNSQITNTSLAFQRDSQTAEFSIMKIQMDLELRNPLNHFEHTNTFKYYFPKNNLQSVLFKQETHYSPNKLNNLKLPQIFSQLIQYLMYPYIYIEKYLFYKQNEMLPAPTISKQRTMFTKSIVNRVLNKTQQNFRVNQIRPMSDGAILTRKPLRFMKQK